MTTLLTALESAIERYGRAAITDPLALAGALRAATSAPSEREIAVLSQVAAGAALPRLRSAVEQGADPEGALAVAVDAAQPVDADGPAVRWALIMLGAALGLLPRSLATGAGPLPDPGDDPTVTQAAPAAAGMGMPGTAGTAPSRMRKARPLLAVAATAIVALAAAGAFLLPGGSTSVPAGVASVPALPGPTTATSATAAPADADAPAPPASGGPDFSGNATDDPRLAFRDPGLLALAEPYLRTPGVSCVAESTVTNLQELVSCYLGGRWIGGFGKYLSVDRFRFIRAAQLEGALARPGTVRSLRWRYVSDRPGVKTGIPAGRGDLGEGVRIRLIAEDGVPFLYFDQDSTLSYGLLSSADPATDLDMLRAFWADPTR